MQQLWHCAICTTGWYFAAPSLLLFHRHLVLDQIEQVTFKKCSKTNRICLNTHKAREKTMI